MLSNAGFDFGDPFRNAPFGALFERIFVSAELGLLKPDPAVYARSRASSASRSSRWCSSTTRQVNVDGAVALGATGHHFTDVRPLREFLTTLAEPA